MPLRLLALLAAAAAGGGHDGVVSLEALRLLPANVTDVVYIGDLHGDAGCAREWVAMTGFVDVDALAWTGPATGGLVFLGDYVDKGVESRRVLEFVRSLEAAFPDRVAALMGNHDLFMYLDATLDGRDATRPMGHAVGAFPYSFFHPEEFVAAGFSPARADDGEILDEAPEEEDLEEPDDYMRDAYDEDGDSIEGDDQEPIF